MKVANYWKEGTTDIKDEYKSIFEGVEIANGKTQIKWKIPPEHYDILRDPNLFNNICSEFNKKVVGEELSCKAIFLCSLGRLVDNAHTSSYNLLVNDDAGTGKDYITNSVLSILPKSILTKRTRISPTALTYWHSAKKEPTWSWNGKVFYAEDISENVLNSDVFKLMCSSGSTATIVINQTAVDIDIEGKPVIITTTASATPNPELVRRFVILQLDSSQNQTKAILKRHSEYASKGIVPEYNSDYTECMYFLERIKVKIPFAELIYNYFPNSSIIMRTNFPRFMDFIKAVTALYQYQREKDNEGFILSTGEDYDIARECFIRLFSNKYMIPLTKNQRKILDFFEESPHLKGSLTELHSKISFISDRGLSYNLRLLVNYGLIEINVDKDNLNRDIDKYSISKNYNPNQKIMLPKYEELCRITSVSSVTSLSSSSSISSVTRDSEDTEDSEDEKRPPELADLRFILLDKPEIAIEDLIKKGFTQDTIDRLLLEGVIYEARSGFVRLVI